MTSAVLDSAPSRGRVDERPSLLRLAWVELRKMADTRSGSWLLLGIAALTITLPVVTAAVGEAQDHTLRNLVSAALFPVSVLLPVVGILLVSSEWSQRTAMITFALVPDRLRVLAAKLVAGVSLSMAALAIALGVGVGATAAVAPDVDGAWSLPVAMLGQEAVLVATGMIMGLAFGAMLLSSPPAIVLYFGLPLGFQALAAIPGFDGPAGWLDGSRSLRPVTEHVLSAAEWARVGTTLAAWMLVPLLVGAWRMTRSEVR
jgi:ABC-2 type transport system permease protein